MHSRLSINELIAVVTPRVVFQQSHYTGWIKCRGKQDPVNRMIEKILDLPSDKVSAFVREVVENGDIAILESACKDLDEVVRNAGMNRNVCNYNGFYNAGGYYSQHELILGNHLAIVNAALTSIKASASCTI